MVVPLVCLSVSPNLYSRRIIVIVVVITALLVKYFTYVNHTPLLRAGCTNLT